jgi:RNA 3'-terminal phosphate cyclase (ATP)
MSELIQIDGSTGGGQLLRSSLSLSALSGRPFAISDIRKPRRRPGLMRQHLAAVRAMTQICDAQVEGAELGSTHLTFCPGPVRAGSYEFAIGTAGSACLVLQTVLPPLMVTHAPSELRIAGGTHNPLAPPYPYLDRVFLPVLERMGAKFTRTLGRSVSIPRGAASSTCASSRWRRYVRGSCSSVAVCSVSLPRPSW